MARISDWLGRDGGGPINADVEGRRELAGRGFETKNGVLCSPSSTGELVPLWPERPIFFDRDPKHRAFRDAAIKSLQPEYAALVARYIYEASRLRSPEAAFGQLESFEQKALVEGSDTAGGFLVPASVATEIL